MTTLSQLVITLMDPFHIGRNFVVFPIWRVLNRFYSETKQKTTNGVLSVRDVILRIIILLFAFGVVLWTAVFMYIGFYYTYMPVTAHSKAAHMQFTPCDDGKGICSFPQSHIPLTKNQQLLMIGQPYRVLVMIDMPESPNNQNLGMFLVCGEMRDSRGNLKAHACRTAILHYKSTLLNWITTWMKSPFFILGLREEKQEIEIEIFKTFHDDDQSPVTDVYVEIQSKQIEFYGVSLHITAHFTGLRYFMFHWPLLAAAIGICSNLSFIIIICLLSWYHWTSDGEWLEGAREKLERHFSRTKSASDPDTPSAVEELVDGFDGQSNTKTNGNSLPNDQKSPQKTEPGLLNRGATYLYRRTTARIISKE